MAVLVARPSSRPHGHLGDYPRSTGSNAERRIQLLLERAQARVAATAAVATQWRRKVERRDAQIRSERGEHRVERRRLQTECRVARQEARVALRERGATTRYAEAQEAAREVTDRRADALRVELEAAQQEILVLKRRAAENDRARRRGCRLATADRAALIEARETAAAADTRSRQFETVSAQLRGYVDQMEDELRQLAAVRARENNDWAGLLTCGPGNTWRRYGCSAIALLQRRGAGGSSRVGRGHSCRRGHRVHGATLPTAGTYTRCRAGRSPGYGDGGVGPHGDPAGHIHGFGGDETLSRRRDPAGRMEPGTGRTLTGAG